MNSQPRPPTNLALILLTLITGIALGWLLHDLFRGSASQALAPTTQPAARIQQPTTALPATRGAPATTRPSTATLPAPPTATAEPQPTNALATQPAAGTTPSPEATAAAAPTRMATRQPTAAPPPATVPAATDQIAGYRGHIVGQSETLATIAKAGGSRPDLIARYNLLDGEPRAGRALIVPQLSGRTATLADQPLLVKRGPADKPWVALTLDAGAGAEPTPRMLAALRERKITITFFLTGQWIKDNPELTRQIVADGHEIANHTFSHPDLTRVGTEAMRKDLAETAQLMHDINVATTRPLFRPPYGAYDEQVLRTAAGQGYLPVYWTLDSLDSVGEPKTPAFLLDRVTNTLTPEQLRGAIILAHCGSAPTADALPEILDRFAEMGFEVKKVSEVLGE
jgi:peptidoglycan/xylan/chitin deacetylase (PgdA/CDA1 family)